MLYTPAEFEKSLVSGYCSSASIPGMGDVSKKRTFSGSLPSHSKIVCPTGAPTGVPTASTGGASASVPLAALTAALASLTAFLL